MKRLDYKKAYIFVLYYYKIKKEMKKYIVNATTDRLMKINAINEAQHTQCPSERLIDSASRAFFSLKEEYGINYVISTKELQQRTGCPPSTYNSNICGGVNGLLSHIEKTVLLRFVEAVDRAEPDLDSLNVHLKCNG